MHTQHQQQQAFQQWAASEDAKFQAAHPELQDRKARWEAQEDILEYLKDKHGMSEAQFRVVFNSDPTVRAANGLSTLYDAARQYRAEKNLKNARRPEPTPAFQRPGTGNLRVVSGGNADAERLRAISAQPTLRKQIAEAAKGLAEKRRVAKQGRK